MIKVLKSNPIGFINNTQVCYFEFELFKSTSLPTKTYQLGLTTYLIADSSIALDNDNKIAYQYNEGKWGRIPYTSPVTIDNAINDNGNYSIPANTISGINNVDVDVPSQEPTLISKSITANGIYNATDDEADGYSSVDVNVSVTGIPKLVSPSSLVEALKKYKCAHIHNIGEENRGRISLTVVRGETWVSAPSVVKCYGVATFPVQTITFTNDNQYYKNCTIIFTADSSNIIAEYFNGTMWNTINWGRSFTVGKVYRADFEIEIVQGNVASVVVNTVTEYDEPILFTVE